MNKSKEKSSKFKLKLLSGWSRSNPETFVFVLGEVVKKIEAASKAEKDI